MTTASLGKALDATGGPTAQTGSVRVLHVNSGNLYGGVETIIATLARLKDLCPAMHSEFALCFEGRLSQELGAAGAQVHLLGRVRFSQPWTVWRARRRLLQILEGQHFDLVMCHMPWSLAVFGPAVRRTGRKLGFSAHTVHSGTGWLERLARLTPPDLVIACSRFTEASTANLFPQTPAEVIYPPLDLTPLADPRQARALLRNQLNTPDDAVVVVQVSRIEALKGHRTHLEALARLKDLAAPWVCWMVGGAQRPEEQEYLEALKRMAETLGLRDRVRFLGQRSDVQELLTAADIFCQPNQTPDAFGIVFVEALWAGRPVLTSKLGGALEIVDQSCGMLTPAGDVAALAEALRRLIEDGALRASLGQAGRARAMQLSDPATQMSRLSSIAARLGTAEDHA